MNEFYATLIPVLSDILRALITLVFSAVIIPWVVKTVIPWMKEKRIYDFVKRVVRAAEKLADAGTISKESKLDYGISILEKNGIKVDATVRAMIESAVGDLDDEVARNMVSLVDAINEADIATEILYSGGKVVSAEMDSRTDDEDDNDEDEN